MNKTKSCLIGLGHPYRGDDGLGPKVIDVLRPQLPPQIDTFKDPGDMGRLLEWFEQYEQIYLIDAICTAQEPPGTFHCIDLTQTEIPDHNMKSSSHILNLSQTIQLSKTLGFFPKTCLCFGLEAEQFNHGNELSKQVADNFKYLCDRILEAIAKE